MSYLNLIKYTIIVGKKWYNRSFNSTHDYLLYITTFMLVNLPDCQSIEAEVNVSYPKLWKSSKDYGQLLLFQQIQRLQVCL